MGGKNTITLATRVVFTNAFQGQVNSTTLSFAICSKGEGPDHGLGKIKGEAHSGQVYCAWFSCSPISALPHDLSPQEASGNLARASQSGSETISSPPRCWALRRRAAIQMAEAVAPGSGPGPSVSPDTSLARPVAMGAPTTPRASLFVFGGAGMCPVQEGRAGPWQGLVSNRPRPSPAPPLQEPSPGTC